MTGELVNQITGEMMYGKMFVLYGDYRNKNAEKWIIKSEDIEENEITITSTKTRLSKTIGRHSFGNMYTEHEAEGLSMGLLAAAFSQYGVREYVGEAHNDDVLKYFHDCGFEWVKDDEMAWCSAFMNWCAKVSGCELTGKLNARSWLEVGHKIDEPILGDVLVFWRESPESWKGHVGIYINDDNDNFYVLGGNQDNQVCIKEYPKDRLLEARRLYQV